MPPRVYPRVKGAVTHALTRAAQTRLQAEADSHLGGGGLAADVLAALRVERAEWTVVRNVDRASFVLARLRWTDGVTSRYCWRVPYDTPVGVGAGTNLFPVCYLTLDRWVPVVYPSGARAGSGPVGGQAPKTHPRSRPEIGRKFAKSLRNKYA